MYKKNVMNQEFKIIILIYYFIKFIKYSKEQMIIQSKIYINDSLSAIKYIKFFHFLVIKFLKKNLKIYIF